MQWIDSVLEKIVCYLLFASLLEQFAKKGSAKKYIRFFAGILLCISFLQYAKEAVGNVSVADSFSVEKQVGECEEKFYEWEEKKNQVSEKLRQDEKDRDTISIQKVEWDDGTESKR